MANYFNLRKFAAMRHERYYDEFWVYKGYKCGIEKEVEEDNIKYYVDIETPDGKMLHPNLHYSDVTRKNIEKFIDSLEK